MVEQNVRSWTDHAAAIEDWERQHQAEWANVDQKLRGIARRRAALDVEEASLLRWAEELKLWRAFGFGSLVEYMERVMGYAPHTSTERLRVARALGELPLIAEALERGELAHSAVRELSRVAVPDTEAVWLEAAHGKSLREIEAMVSGHRPGDLPSDKTEPRLHRKTITLEVSPEAYDIWRRLHVLAAEEHGQRLSDDELLLSLFRRAYADASERCAGGNSRDGGDSHGHGGDGCHSGDSHGHCGNGRQDSADTNSDRHAHDGDGRQSGDSHGHGGDGRQGDDNHGHDGVGRQGGNSHGHGGDGRQGSTDTNSDSRAHGRGRASAPAYRLALKQCPDCRRAWEYTGGRDIEVDPALFECASCDAVHLGSLDAASPERATTTVTPRKREQVLARDGHCCTVPGCRRAIGLDLHHIEYQHRGGGHDLSNLTAICDLHHRAIHFGKLVVQGSAPDRLTFEFCGLRDRRNVTDDDAVTPTWAPAS